MPGRARRGGRTRHGARLAGLPREDIVDGARRRGRHASAARDPLQALRRTHLPLWRLDGRHVRAHLRRAPSRENQRRDGVQSARQPSSVRKFPGRHRRQLRRDEGGASRRIPRPQRALLPRTVHDAPFHHARRQGRDRATRKRARTRRVGRRAASRKCLRGRQGGPRPRNGLRRVRESSARDVPPRGRLPRDVQREGRATFVRFGGGRLVLVMRGRAASATGIRGTAGLARRCLRRGVGAQRRGAPRRHAHAGAQPHARTRAVRRRAGERFAADCACGRGRPRGVGLASAGRHRHAVRAAYVCGGRDAAPRAFPQGRTRQASKGNGRRDRMARAPRRLACARAQAPGGEKDSLREVRAGPDEPPAHAVPRPPRTSGRRVVRAGRSGDDASARGDAAQPAGGQFPQSRALARRHEGPVLVLARGVGA